MESVLLVQVTKHHQEIPVNVLDAQLDALPAQIMLLALVVWLIMDLTIIHAHFVLETRLLLEESILVPLAPLVALLALHQILQLMPHVTLALMVMAITIKLKLAAFVQQAQLPLVAKINVYYVLAVARHAHQKITLHLTLPALLVFLIMDMRMVFAHYVLETKLLKVVKLFVLIVQVDAIFVMALFAHHAKITTSYLTILVKFVQIALFHWEEILLSVLHAVVIVLVVMQLVVLPARMALL